MIPDAPWRVSVHDDDVNTIVAIWYLLQTLCGLDSPQAQQTALDIHQRGQAEVGAFGDRATAEALVVSLQRHGLHATAGNA